MLSSADRRFLAVLSRLAYCNPFLPERLELEREALGREYEPEEFVAWSKDSSRQEHERPNVRRLSARAEKLADQLRAKLHDGAQPDETPLELYQDLISYVLYYRYTAQLDVEKFLRGGSQLTKKVKKIWKEFLAQFHHYLSLPNRSLADEEDPAHWFASLYQVRRAFLSIFDHILGESLPAVQLRAMVWQSVFTHDMRRYRRVLFPQMRELTTLITGPSGTGKELVARASRFREDLYYRLCSDQIRTPALRDQLDDRPDALRGLISFIAQGLVASEAETLTDEVEAWIKMHICTDYPWPGNIRELEQCVHNVLVRQKYEPRPLAKTQPHGPEIASWLQEAERGTLTFAELLSRYCTAVYAKLGSYQQTAEVLGLDRRTVRSKIDGELLKTLPPR